MLSNRPCSVDWLPLSDPPMRPAASSKPKTYKRQPWLCRWVPSGWILRSISSSATRLRSTVSYSVFAMDEKWPWLNVLGIAEGHNRHGAPCLPLQSASPSAETNAPERPVECKCHRQWLTLPRQPVARRRVGPRALSLRHTAHDCPGIGRSTTATLVGVVGFALA